MGRRSIVCLVTLAVGGSLLGAPAGAATRLQLMPGVTYERDVEFTPGGPVALNVIVAPRPTGLYSLRPVLSNDAILDRERVTDIQKRVSPTATVAGVNGDLFNFADGHPSGVLMQGGVLQAPPSSNRSSIGIGPDGTLRVDRIRFVGDWRGTGQRRPLVGLNEPPGPNGTTLYTTAWGATTQTGPGTEVVLAPFPATTPNVDLAGTVTSVRTEGGTPIPPGGAVLVSRGSQAPKLAAEASAGGALTVRLILNPGWAGVTGAIGGGPVIVRDGRAVFRANEAFSVDQLAPRNPRTAVGQRADGRILLVAVDGRQPGYSVGVTNFELAQALVRLGAVTASALDAGGSTTMAFEGTLLNRPSDPEGERPVSEALLVAYEGVYLPLPGTEVLSANGDGVGDVQNLAFKVVRPAVVEEKLLGPAGTVVTLSSGPRQPGTYPAPFPATPLAEGRWRYSVTATDDRGVRSLASRRFWINATLGFLRAPRSVRIGARGSSLRGTYELTRPARVTVTVETPAGFLVRTLTRAALQPAGSMQVAWDGRDDKAQPIGAAAYALRVRAVNAYGPADLTAGFTARPG